MIQDNDPVSTFAIALEQLNPRQLQAVLHIEGPVLVLAGPGTGKTQLLSARIGNILLQTDAQPQNILCLTYTDAGTIAMRKRLLQFIGPEAYWVNIHTFHSFCNMVIQENLEYFGMRDLQAITELESIDLFYKLIDSFGGDNPLKKYTGDIYSNIKRLQGLFDTMKKEDLTPILLNEKIDEYISTLPYLEEYQYKRAYKEFKKGDIKEKDIKEETDRMLQLKAAVNEFSRFQAMMLKEGRYDFNDMINWVIKAFRDNDTLLGRYQEKYLYILVDEFQDTNGSQSEILDLLTSYWDNPNLFVVGDDDQAIYSFQGAEVKRITEFVNTYSQEIFPVVLENNYRSTQQILDAARAVVENNSRRLTTDLHLTEKLGQINKVLISSGEEADTSTIEIREYLNNLHQEAGITKEISERYARGENLGDMAIIYRSHKDVAGIMRSMDHLKIPYNARLKVDILTLPFIQNLITIFRYLHEERVNPGGGEHYFFELMHYDFFGIDPRDAAMIARECSRKRDDTSATSWRLLTGSKQRMFQLGLSTAGAISSLDENLTHWIKALYNETLQVVFEKIIAHGHIISFIMQSDEKIWLLEVLNTFFDFIKEESAKNPEITLETFLRTIDKMMQNKICISVNKIIHHENGVNLLTAHSSKGLEFDTVYMINCTSESWEKKRGANFNFKLPPNVALSGETIRVEEERRLFYVGMTRAKKNLFLCYPQMKLKDVSRELATLEKSMFISEITAKENVAVVAIQLPDVDVLQYTVQTITEAKIDHLTLEKEFIQDTLKNYKLSITHLNKYIRCPVTFYFENILRVPSARTPSMGFGSAIHYALERLFAVMKQSPEKQFPTIDQFVRYFEAGMRRHASHFTASEFDLKIEYGHKLLPDFYNFYINTWSKNITTEYRVNGAVMEDIPLTGALDKIEFVGGDCNVIDYKTGDPDNAKSKLCPPNEKEPLGGEYWRQIIFYKILLEADKTQHWNMLSGEIDFIQKPKKKDDFVKERIYVKPDDMALIKGLIRSTYQKIMSHEFSPGCGKDDCQWCNFVKYNYKKDVLQATSTEEVDG